MRLRYLLQKPIFPKVQPPSIYGESEPWVGGAIFAYKSLYIFISSTECVFLAHFLQANVPHFLLGCFWLPPTLDMQLSHLVFHKSD